MNPRENLLLFLREWRRRTVAETAGIRAQNWALVKECQEAKRQLQALLEEATEPHSQPDALERELVQELISMENQNSRFLQEQKDLLQARQRELENSSRTLRRVRGSYARVDTARWESYS
jgi:hypothetical protein